MQNLISSCQQYGSLLHACYISLLKGSGKTVIYLQGVPAIAILPPGLIPLIVSYVGLDTIEFAYRTDKWESVSGQKKTGKIDIAAFTYYIEQWTSDHKFLAKPALLPGAHESASFLWSDTAQTFLRQDHFSRKIDALLHWRLHLEGLSDTLPDSLVLILHCSHSLTVRPVYPCVSNARWQVVKSKTLRLELVSIGLLVNCTFVYESGPGKGGQRNRQRKKCISPACLVCKADISRWQQRLDVILAHGITHMSCPSLSVL